MAGKTTHWIDGPNTLAMAAMDRFGGKDLSQRRLLEAAMAEMPVRSVVDFGCGRGAWLKAATNLGIADIRGYDIPEIDVTERNFPADRFFPADLSQPIDPGRRFDLAVTTEVAEHIPLPGAANFIANVCAASDYVLFSAAPPYQGGAGHNNEQWVEYWAKLFAEHGYDCFDILRARFWHDGAIRSYYRQNVMLFATGAARDRLVAKGHAVTRTPLTLIHPEQYLKAVNRCLPPEMARLNADVRQYYDAVFERPAEVDAKPYRHAYGHDVVSWKALLYKLGL